MLFFKVGVWGCGLGVIPDCLALFCVKAYFVDTPFCEHSLLRQIQVNNEKWCKTNNHMGDSFQDYSWIQDFEAAELGILW